MTETKNVFISHVHKDDHGLQKLKDLLLPKGIQIRDSSIHTGKFNNAKDESYIKSQVLAPTINWSSVFICYVSPQTKDSEWVNWEIEYAAKQGKRIVGIWEHGEKECDLPCPFRKPHPHLDGLPHLDLGLNFRKGQDR